MSTKKAGNAKKYCINSFQSGSWLDISIDRCKFDHLQENMDKKTVKEVSGLKIDGCMHPLPKIDRCSCTSHTCSNKDPDFNCQNIFLF